MRPLSSLLLLVIILFSGCMTHNSAKGEKKVDQELAAPPPAGTPEAGPGEPQKQFDQEVTQAR